MKKFDKLVFIYYKLQYSVFLKEIAFLKLTIHTILINLVVIKF